jgi:hypothetical protein
MTMQALAGASDVPATTVWDYEEEAGRRNALAASDIAAMRRAKAGVEFIDDVGVELKRSAKG